MYFDYLALITGLVSVVIGLVGALRLALSLSNEVDRFDSSTRNRFEILKPRIWHVISSASNAFYSYMQEALSNQEDPGTVEDLFRDHSMEDELIVLMQSLADSFSRYATVDNIKKEWRHSLRRREKIMFLICLLVMATSVTAIAFGIIGEVADSIVGIIALVLIVLWIVMIILFGFSWRECINHREKSAKCWDFVEENSSSRFSEGIEYEV